MILTYSDDCNGCMAFDKGNGCEMVNEDSSCPCGQCIVRAMCEDWCHVSINWKNDKHAISFTEREQKKR